MQRIQRREQRRFCCKSYRLSRAVTAEAAEILGFAGSLATLALIFAADFLQMQQNGIGASTIVARICECEMLAVGSPGTLAASGRL